MCLMGSGGRDEENPGTGSKEVRACVCEQWLHITYMRVVHKTYDVYVLLGYEDRGKASRTLEFLMFSADR